jgi:hypothetical protein
VSPGAITIDHDATISATNGGFFGIEVGGEPVLFGCDRQSFGSDLRVSVLPQ